MNAMRIMQGVLLLTATWCLPVVNGATTATGVDTSSLSKQERYQLMLQQEHQEQRRTPQTKIVGGTEVPSINKYPFFLEWEDAKCGASLIHDDIALSAAHCENDAHPFDTRVFMLSLDTEQGLARYVERGVSHPLYSGALQDYDFMILKLSESALVDPAGNPTGAGLVNLNRNASVPQVGDALTGMGFGKLSETADDTSPNFMEVEIYYISNTICFEQYGSSDFVPELMFCAGIQGVGGQDTCQGDSGGPIIHQATNTQVGVVSFGVGCAQADYAGVNARVESVIEWIEGQVCDMSDMPPASCFGAGGTIPPNYPPPDVLPTGGSGALTVHVQYDDYPEETAWALTYLDMAPGQEPLQLFLHPFAQDDTIADRDLVTESFPNLPAGSYQFQLGDQAGDGNCCGYGRGRIWITNDADGGTTIWENNGQYGSYVSVKFEMYPSGAVTLLEEVYDYENSWEAFDAVNHPPTFDAEWPGALPAANLNVVTINVKFDAFPEEITWTFEEERNPGNGGGNGNGNSNGNSNGNGNANGQWTELKSFDGATEGLTNSLVSVEMANLKQGWHRFRISDTQGDGICCQYRRGWVSLTAPLVTTKLKGLVWGNNGEFGSGVDVYVLIDQAGYVSQVSYSDPLVTSTTRTGSLLRKTNLGERRIAEQPRRHELCLSTWTDLPKQQLKRLPSER